MNWFKALRLIVINALLLEIMLASIYFFNIFSVFSWRNYPNAFEEVKLGDSALGWTSYENRPRPGNDSRPRKCAAIFGNSFVHADEVSNEQAWPTLASNALNCEVLNYGTGGYGTDQSVLKQKQIAPMTEYVFLGIYREMIKRNLAASWTFYAAVKKSTVKPVFKLRNGHLYLIPYPADANEIQNYHENDQYYKSFRISFPFTLSFSRKVFHRVLRRVHAENQLDRGSDIYDDPEAMDLQMKLMAAFYDNVKQSGAKPGFIFFPSPEEAAEGKFFYFDLMEWLIDSLPKSCVIDVGADLKRFSDNVGNALAAPQGHFDADGNIIIATSFADQLKACVKKASIS